MILESATAAGTNWDALSAVATSAAAIFAAYAAWQSKRQVDSAVEAARISADASQVQVFENIFRDIQQQEQLFHGRRDLTPEDKALRDRMFFNTVNYLAFLLDAKILRKPEFLGFYRDAFLYWWSLFEKEVPEIDRADPQKYGEFKSVVSLITNPPPTFRTIS